MPAGVRVVAVIRASGQSAFQVALNQRLRRLGGRPNDDLNGRLAQARPRAGAHPPGDHQIHPLLAQPSRPQARYVLRSREFSRLMMVLFWTFTSIIANVWQCPKCWDNLPLETGIAIRIRTLRTFRV